MPNKKKAMTHAMGTVSQPTWPAVQKGRMVSQHSRNLEVCRVYTSGMGVRKILQHNWVWKEAVRS
jgi:hypothetical protein